MRQVADVTTAILEIRTLNDLWHCGKHRYFNKGFAVEKFVILPVQLS